MNKALMFALGLLFALPLAADAQAYGCNGGFFMPCSPQSGMREELFVYAWGPETTAQSPYNNYNAYQPYYQPSYQSYQPMYQPSYNYYQPTYSYYQPSYQSYYQPAYYEEYYYQPYSYYPQYSQPTYGYGPQPMGTQDFWGNDLCDWGGGYRGYSCSGSHPAQWILDPYTGQYY